MYNMKSYQNHNGSSGIFFMPKLQKSMPDMVYYERKNKDFRRTNLCGRIHIVFKRTDLGVDRAYTGQGIGKQLTRMQLGSMRSLAWIF